MGFAKEILEANKTQGTNVKILCAECNRATNHQVFVSADVSGSELYDSESNIYISWEKNYQIVQCKGCETLSFRRRSWFSEDDDPFADEPGYREQLYPKRDANTLKIREFRYVPPIIRRIYEESVKSCNDDCFTLCAAGLRALVEGICADRSIIDGPLTRDAKDGSANTTRSKSLAGKIAGLAEKSILTTSSADTLHGLRFLGNEALHELAHPAFRELQLAFDIVEHVLEHLYEMPEKALKLKRYAERRKGRKV